ncbi:MAG: hypothetical protein WKF43_04920 [Acidimicrobiales bacterium]
MTQSASMGGDTDADNDSSTDTAALEPTVAPEPYGLGEGGGPLDRDELRLVEAWWRAANHLSVGQIYLMDNPLLREPLQAEHVKPRLLGHLWTVPGLNLVHAHLNRFIRARDLDAVFVAGPGHGGPSPNACAWLEGTYSDVFTPLDGLVMATRCGSLDAGAVLWLARHTDEDLPAVLEHESGLSGLCGDSDMPNVIRGGCVATLGGVDALVFTGGVGEHSYRLRELVGERLGWLGLAIDPQATGEEITAPGARARTFVIPSGEDLEMAGQAADTIET